MGRSAAENGPEIRRRGQSAPREITEDMVSIVSVLVPSADRTTIRADLEETRSVEKTTVRLLEKEKSKQTTAQSQQTDEEIVARPEEPKPEDWFNDRAQRELHKKQQREKMIAKARLRTRELAQKE